MDYSYSAVKQKVQAQRQPITKSPMPSVSISMMSRVLQCCEHFVHFIIWRQVLLFLPYWLGFVGFRRIRVMARVSSRNSYGWDGCHTCYLSLFQYRHDAGTEIQMEEEIWYGHPIQYPKLSLHSAYLYDDMVFNLYKFTSMCLCAICYKTSTAIIWFTLPHHTMQKQGTARPCQWCSHLMNALEAALTMASLPFQPFLLATQPCWQVGLTSRVW